MVQFSQLGRKTSCKCVAPLNQSLENLDHMQYNDKHLLRTSTEGYSRKLTRLTRMIAIIKLLVTESCITCYP